MSSVALLHKFKSKEGLDLYYSIALTGQRGYTFICMRIMALGRGTHRCLLRKLIYCVPHLRLDLSLSEN